MIAAFAFYFFTDRPRHGRRVGRLAQRSHAAHRVRRALRGSAGCRLEPASRAHPGRPRDRGSTRARASDRGRGRLQRAGHHQPRPRPRVSLDADHLADEREAFDWIRTSTPPDAIVQVESFVRGSKHWAYMQAFAQRRSIGIGMGSMIPEKPYRDASEEIRRRIFLGTSVEDIYLRGQAVRHQLSRVRPRRASALHRRSLADRCEPAALSAGFPQRRDHDLPGAVTRRARTGELL